MARITPSRSSMIESSSRSICRKLPTVNVVDVLRRVVVMSAVIVAVEVASALEMDAARGSGCLAVVFQAGDRIMADPRCIVSRGMGLAIDPTPKPTPPERSMLKGLKQTVQKLTKSDDNVEEEEPRTPLQTISNTMSSNVTDCILAPAFPGDIALVSVTSAFPPTRDDVRGEEATAADEANDDETARPRPSSRKLDGGKRKRKTETGLEESTSPQASNGVSRNFIVTTQALVAVGPDVSVSPFLGSGEGGSKRGIPPSAVRSSRRGTDVYSYAFGSKRAGWSLSLCEGNGPVAIAGCGRLKRMRLKAGQKRIVDSSYAVGWTDDVSWVLGPSSVRGIAGGSSKRAPDERSNSLPGSVINFKGPGVVFVQTHSIAGLRRLLTPPPSVLLRSGNDRFRRGPAGGSGAGPAAMAEVGLSLKRGLAKRAKARVKAGARRLLLASAFFALYVAVYSVATALLLEGREGLRNAPRHALQVVRSLAKVVRHVALVVVRLGQEEIWRKEGGGRSGDTGGSVQRVAAETTVGDR